MRALFFLLAVATSASAQPARSTWASAGVGATVGGGVGLPGASLSVTAPLGSGREVVHVGGSAAAVLVADAAIQRVYDLHVGYGYAVGGRRGVAALAVGPALVGVEGAGARRSGTTFGGFVSVQGLAAVSRRVGLGAEAVGQASGSLSTLSARLVLAVGRF